MVVSGSCAWRKRLGSGRAVADDDEEITVAVHSDAATLVGAQRSIAQGRHGAEDTLHVGEFGVVLAERRAIDHDVTVRTIGHVFAIAEEDAAVLRKVLVQREIEQADLALEVHHRHALDGFGQRAVLRNGAHSAGLFGDQHLAVGQERERPRLLQLVGDDLHLVALTAGFVGSVVVCFCGTEIVVAVRDAD